MDLSGSSGGSSLERPNASRVWRMQPISDTHYTDLLAGSGFFGIASLTPEERDETESWAFMCSMVHWMGYVEELAPSR